MSISDVMKALRNLSPPFQPYVTIQVSDYQERQTDWKTLSIKKGALYYQFRTHPDPDSRRVQVLPDACMNVLFICDASKPGAVLSGPFFKPKLIDLQPDTEYFGFKPYSVFGLNWETCTPRDLADTFMNLADVYPSAANLIRQIVKSRSFDERIRLFNEYAETYLIDHNYHSSFVDYYSAILCSSAGDVLFNNLRQTIGYSNRYSRGKFKEVYGYSPKKYSEVMRFQKVLKNLLQNNPGDLSDMAVDTGYFDQAHFIHDFEKFTLTSPAKFRKIYMSARNRFQVTGNR